MGYIYTMEHYSAIKRNTFEYVLTRWTKLGPIIQSEGSQKEEEKRRTPTHIRGRWTDGTGGFTLRAAVEKQTQRTDLWTRRGEEGEGGTCGERDRNSQDRV